MATQHESVEDSPQRRDADAAVERDFKQLTLAERREGLTRFIDRAPPLLAALESAGLRGDQGISAETIETVLIEDPYWCDACDGTPAASERMCPQSNRPHRRFLVLVAEALLKLVGEARAVVSHGDQTKQLIHRPASMDDLSAPPQTEAVGKHAGALVRRGIPINPQLMLLAFHASVRADSEIDPVHRELACHLVQGLELLKQALTASSGSPATQRGISPAQRQHIGRLVFSFARAWREYLRVAATIALSSTEPASGLQSPLRPGGPVTSPTTPMTPFISRKAGSGSMTTTADHAQKELVRSAVDTYVALVDLRTQLRARKDTAVAIEQLQVQLDAVERRIERIGGEAALAQLQTRLDNAAHGPGRNRAAAAAASTVSDVGSSPAATPAATPTTSAAVLPRSDSGLGPKLEARRPRPLNVSSPSAASDSDDVDDARRSDPNASDVPCVLPGGGMTPHVPPRFRVRQRAARHRQPMATLTSASESEFPAAAAETDDVDSDAPKEASTTDAAAGAGTDSVSSQDRAAAAKAAKFALRRSTPMGPTLPPKWTVGRDGKSHPPPKPSPQQVANERKGQIEFKTQAAYKARLALQQVSARQASPEEQAQRNVVSKVEETMWVALKQELLAKPANMARIPQLLSIVGEGLSEALPKRLRSRVSQEIRDALDWHGVVGTRRDGHAASLHDVRGVANILSYVADRVVEYGAAAMEDQVRATADSARTKLLDAVNAGVSDEKIAEATVGAIRWMFKAVKDLHEAIATFGMAFISPELAGMAVESAQEFVKDWMAPPVQWKSSQDWFTAATKAAVKNAVIAFRAGRKPTRGEVEMIVATGVMGLCASAKKPLQHRWDAFPAEALYFERPAVFASANTLQFCALRLMIVNTVSLLVSQPNKRISTAAGAAKPRLSREATQSLTKKLDDHLRVWLGMAPGADDKGPLSLAKLKDEVCADVNYALIDAHHAEIEQRKVQAGDVALSEAEQRMLMNVVEKVSHTDSNEYVAFEGRIVAAVTADLIRTIKENCGELSSASSSSSDGSGSDSDDDGRLKSAPSEVSPFERLGVIAADLEDVTGDLARVVALNVEVHKALYDDWAQAAVAKK